MNRTSAELKRLARENLVGHWGLMIGAVLLLSLIMFAVLIPFYFLFFISGGGYVQLGAYLVAALIVGIVSVIMQCGISRMQIGFARNQETGIGMLFGEFVRRPDRYIVGILIMIGVELLCILPGTVCLSVGVAAELVPACVIGAVLYLAGTVLMVMFTFRFSLVFFLLIDNLQMGAVTAFRESARWMNGNKGRLFYIYLSYIGWGILGILSCGLGMLWISPYMNQTLVSFYLDVTGELDRGQWIQPENDLEKRYQEVEGY
ncbi:hypothetical protein C806_01759 [Lachnospiraceae bacterium 3-1]|nr:hypothetical protein C806_01759 [Lachnospiraceae bacterium 3-1]